MLWPLPEPFTLAVRSSCGNLVVSAELWNGPVTETSKLPDWLPDTSAERVRFSFPIGVFFGLLSVSFGACWASSLLDELEPQAATRAEATRARAIAMKGSLSRDKFR